MSSEITPKALGSRKKNNVYIRSGFWEEKREDKQLIIIIIIKIKEEERKWKVLKNRKDSRSKREGKK